MTSARRATIVTRLRSAGCVFAEEEAELLIGAAATSAELDTMIKRRTDGLPLEQVIGWADFHGRRIEVDPGVFVPRRRSEWLVREAIALAPPQATIVDLCCGTGALGVATAAAVAGSRLFAADIDPAAVACARRNVVPIGGQVFAGDLFTALPDELTGKVDVLLANVPYVPTEAVGLLPAEARLYEPRAALDGGPDGLAVLRRVLASAPTWLAPGGHLLVETTEAQAPAAAIAMTHAGLTPRITHHQALSATVVIATHPLPPI